MITWCRLNILYTVSDASKEVMVRAIQYVDYTQLEEEDEEDREIEHHNGQTEQSHSHKHAAKKHHHHADSDDEALDEETLTKRFLKKNKNIGFLEDFNFQELEAKLHQDMLADQKSSTTCESIASSSSSTDKK